MKILAYDWMPKQTLLFMPEAYQRPVEGEPDAHWIERLKKAVQRGEILVVKGVMLPDGSVEMKP